MKLYKVGRALFGGYFIYSGINHFIREKEIAEYAKAKHIPKPDAAVIGTGIALVAGGVSLVLGVKPRWGTIPLIGFLATVSPTVHNFWQDEDAGVRMHNMVDFTKNLALLSGALALAGAEAKRAA